MQSSILVLVRFYPCGVRMKRYLVEYEDEFTRGERQQFLTQGAANLLEDHVSRGKKCSNTSTDKAPQELCQPRQVIAHRAGR